MSAIKWDYDDKSIAEQEYIGNSLLAKETATKGYSAIIQEYVYIDSKNVENTLKLVPDFWERIHGKGIDLGGGVGCISSTLAQKTEIESIYCVEVVEDVVKLCQPIVKKTILQDKSDKVISVIGNFDHLKLDDNSIDFAISWDSMHHSIDPTTTFKECNRVLKRNGLFLIVDRAHNNATPDSEIERMLNIKYSKEFLRKNYRSEDTILSRRDNGEHEYRFFEWLNFFEKSNFELVSNLIIKTETEENKKIQNDAGIKEIFVSYDLGVFGNRKTVFLLRKR